MRLKLSISVVSSLDASRTAENLPWKELGTPGGQEHYLTNPTNFTLLGFINPTTVPSYDTVCKFAGLLMSTQTSPLFKLPSPPGIVSPPSSPAQNVPDLELLNTILGDIIPDEHVMKIAL